VKIDADEETFACCALLVGACLVAQELVNKKRRTRAAPWLAEMNEKGSYVSIHRELSIHYYDCKEVGKNLLAQQVNLFDVLKQIE